MKRLLVFLLALFMIFSFTACKQPNNEPTQPSGDPSATDPSDGKTEKPFAGKTLQLWGDWADSRYTDINNMGEGGGTWAMCAAVDEWAALNDVTIEYVAGYDQNRLLAAMNSGSKPDLITTSNQFPRIANFGLLKPYTQAEYDAIAEVMGKEYLDMMKYRGVAHGWILPGKGESVVYYNKSIFDRYGVKTPGEYLKEGTWTISNFKKCLEETTRDVDGDGKFETYGHPTYNSFRLFPAVPAVVFQQDEKGNLITDGLDSKYLMESLEFKWEMQYEKGTIATGSDNIGTNTTSPMFAMMYSDMALHKAEDCFNVLSNGDQMEVVPMPTYDGDDPAFKDKDVRFFRQTFIATLSSCDEPEAALDLQVYLAKCVLKYVADCSFGRIKCDYEGIVGASEYSKKWKENNDKINKDRADIVAKMDIDWELLDKCFEVADKAEIYTFEPTYDGVTSIVRNSQFSKESPTTAFPVAKAAFEAAVQKYNDLYIYD